MAYLLIAPRETRSSGGTGRILIRLKKSSSSGTAICSPAAVVGMQSVIRPPSEIRFHLEKHPGTNPDWAVPSEPAADPVRMR